MQIEESLKRRIFFYNFYYEIKASDILEIWEYQCSIARSDKKTEVIETDTIKNMFVELKREIGEVKSRIGLVN